MKNISPVSEVLTNVFLNISVSNPAVDVVDAAPNVISYVVDLEGDTLLKTEKRRDLLKRLCWQPALVSSNLCREPRTGETHSHPSFSVGFLAAPVSS